MSFDDNLKPAVREKQARAFPWIAGKFIEAFAPGSRYWGAAHIDRNHVHAHLFISNWSPEWGTSLNWDKRDIAYMLSLRWLPSRRGDGGEGSGPDCVPFEIQPGAYSLKSPSARVYTRSEAAVSLVTAIAANPEAILADLKVERYTTKGNSPGVVWRGKKITVKNLNHELRKAGHSIGLDDAYKNCPLTDISYGEIAQQTRIDLAIGVQKMTWTDYDRFCDLPDPHLLCRTPDEHTAVDLFLSEGRAVKDGRHAAILSRLVRTAIVRRVLGATEPKTKHEARWVYGKPDEFTRLMKEILDPICWQMIGVLPPCPFMDGLLSWSVLNIGRDLVKLWDRVEPPDIPM